ncbi:MAG TPA: helix-turn-helix domain-containing protein [Solirubrobacterales bacterium]|nr:helix-turn-helix domain-containing protein [Solirubrobacterales bacterium]
MAAIGDRDGFLSPLWLDLSRSNWTQRLRRFVLDQGGARLSIATYRSSGSRRSSNVDRCCWVMLDADGSQLWRFATPPPSIVLASGGSSNGRAHVHALWQLDGSASVAEVGKLTRGHGDLLDGDAGFNAGATATVRLPLDPADLLTFEPDRVARPSDLRRQHRPSAVPEPPKATATKPPADRAASVAMAISRALAAVERGESRNVTGWELTGELHRLGLTEEEALAVGRERYAEVVNLSSPLGDPFELEEWEGQVRRRFEHGPAVVDREHVERVDRWEVGWLGQPWLSASQRTIVSAVAGRARREGELTVTVSRRQLGLDARLASLPTIERALKGSKTRNGLLGRALKRDGRKRNGERGAHRFELVDAPPSPPDLATSTPAFPVACYRNAPPPKPASQSALTVAPSSTVPPNHDGWSWTAIGHGARLVFDALLALDRPASVSELARHPSLSNCRKTIRRQLSKLEAAELVVALQDGTREARTDDLESLLDVAAEATERPGPDGKPERLAERIHRRNEDDRRRYEQATEPAERERRERERLQRVCRRRKRGRRSPRRPAHPRFSFAIGYVDPTPASQRRLRPRP